MKLKGAYSLERKLWQPRQHIKKQRLCQKGLWKEVRPVKAMADYSSSHVWMYYSSSHVWMWELDYKESWVPKNWCFWTVVLEKPWESLGWQGDPISPSKRSVLGVHWKEWCWSWNSNTSANWCKELTHLKRPWCWERLRAGGEGGNRGWDDWMASPTQWTWVWVDSGSWWWTGRSGVLQSMGSQRVKHNWATELINKSLNHDVVSYDQIKAYLKIW